jgi:hypothetical protein
MTPAIVAVLRKISPSVMATSWDTTEDLKNRSIAWPSE